jgi:hypothetical protein
MADLQTAVGNGVKLVGEVVVPGASELIEGNVRSGVVHFLIGGVLVAVLAPVFPLLAGLTGIGVRLNSYAQSVSGKNLVEAVRSEPSHEATPARGRGSSASSS